ncbi:DUF6734 family protein [Fibrella sp. WM1]|uniref:DUF6734 family protein n=1 Tax=Fibrella musci TaxID=3242485 RepID=UPI0035228191
MKIVHTFWSCNLATVEELLNHPAGWRESKFHYMSWALSCLLARRHYAEVELVTDEVGKELLVDRLKLPYTSVKVALDGTMTTYPQTLWALPKLVSYQLQQEPFLHIDGDVFLHKPLAPRITTATLVSQNIEVNFPIYHEAIEAIESHFRYVPDSIRANRQTTPQLSASNTGLFGGTNYGFISTYVREAKHFIDQNKAHWDKVNSVYFNCVFEQHLLYCLAAQHRLPITYLLNPVDTFDEYGPIARYMGKSNELGYSHPVGPFKQSPLGCKYVAKGLARVSPDYYRRISKLYPEPASRWWPIWWSYKQAAATL